MTLQPVNIVQFIFVFQAGFGAALLWGEPRFRGLVYLLLLVMASMGLNLLEETGITRELYLITPVITLAKGPFFYLFVYFLVYSELKPKQQYLWHSVPMLMAIPLTQWPQWVIALGSASQLIYGILSLRLIQRYHQVISASRSDAHSLNISWIMKILIAFLVLGALDLIRLNSQQVIPLIWNLVGQFTENTIALILFSLLIVKTLRHPYVYNGLATYETVIMPLTTPLNTVSETSASQAKEPAKESVDDSGPSDDSHLKLIYEHLEQLIRKEQLHHQPRLSLNNIAERSKFNPRDISRAINLVGGMSFCDYINRLRVNDIKNQLDKTSSTKPNLLELAYQFGFNSKSSFNAAFKRERGMTPTQYLSSLT
jgi:AraC-like DNA-binding protein